MISVEDEFNNFNRISKAEGTSNDVKLWFTTMMKQAGAKGRIVKLGDNQAIATVEIPRG